MEHLPRISTPVPEDLRIPYLCKENSISSPGFWRYPEDHGWNRTGLQLGLERHASMALLRSKVGIPLATPRDISALLQGWWYFGLLSEVLQQDVKHSDFVLKDPSYGTTTVTTAQLAEHLHAWESRLALKEPSEAMLQLTEAKRCVDHVHRMVEDLGNFIEKHDPINWTAKNSERGPAISGLKKAMDGKGGIECSAEALLTIIRKGKAAQNTGDAGLEALVMGPQKQGRRPNSVQVAAFEALELTFWVKSGRDVLPENLEVGIGLLGHTLSHAIRRIHSRLRLNTLGEIRHEGWYTPACVHRRLIDTGLCPRQIPRLQPRLLLVGMYLSSLLRHDNHTGDAFKHSGCTSSRCSVDYLREGTYIRRHAAPQCLCEDLPSSSWYDKILSILESGQIPTIRVWKRQDGIEIEALPATDTAYIAFSHIWSDGLGNEDANQLSWCQWERLQDIADNLFPEDIVIKPTPFWLDTICVPVAPLSKQEDPNFLDRCRRRIMRDYAIQRMRDTYQQAKSIVILDGSLLSMKASGMSLVEFGLRFSFSGWMRRLWTMHEGAVAQPGRIFIRTQDGGVSLSQVVEGLQSLIQREESDRESRLLASLGAVEAYQSWLTTLHLITHTDAHNPRNPEYNFTFVWNESRNRATKYEEDRYVVIASLLGLGKPQDLYDCKTSETRMLYLLQHFKPRNIPVGLLFTVSDRLGASGFRWAPSSIDQDEIMTGDFQAPAHQTETGLLVQLPGWKLNKHPNWNRRYLLTNSHWTEEIKNSLDKSGGAAQILSGRCAWVIRTEPDGNLHTVDFATMDDGHRSPQIAEDENLMIIQQPYTRKGKAWNRAVLVAEKIMNRTPGSAASDDGLVAVRYIAALHWNFLSKEDMATVSEMVDEGQYDLCKASPVGDGLSLPRWCVD